MVFAVVVAMMLALFGDPWILLVLTFSVVDSSSPPSTL